jgi:hypothetical protein
MKNRLLSGAAVAILGLLVTLTPVCIFPACTKVIELAGGGTAPMKCFWSGQAEIGAGLLILCGGLLLILCKPAHVRLGISIMTALAGGLGILIPTLLIGGCEMETMTCRMTTIPALVLFNALTAAVCTGNAAWLGARDRKLREGTDGREAADDR